MRFATWLTANLGLKVGAILTAAMLWGVVAYAGNPTSPVTYSVAPTAVGLPKTMGVVDGLDKPVSVVLVGLHDSAERARRLDPARVVEVTVDLSASRPGVVTIPVVVHVLVAGLSVRSYSPEKVALRLDVLGTRSLNLQVLLKGSPGQDYTTDGDPRTSPGSVTLSGPHALIDQATAVVQADISNVSTNFDAPLAVGLLGADNTYQKLPSGVHVDPPNVEVQVSIRRRFISKEVAIVAHFSGQPGEGYFVCGIDQRPLVATVTGAPDRLELTSSVDLPGLDLSGRIASFDASLDVLAPATGATLGNAPRVHLHVCIDRYPQVQTVPSPSPQPTPSPSSPSATPGH